MPSRARDWKGPGLPRGGGQCPGQEKHMLGKWMFALPHICHTSPVITLILGKIPKLDSSR